MALPTQTRFGGPATLTITRPDGSEEVSIGSDIEWDQDDPRFFAVMTHHAFGDERYYTLATLDAVGPDRWEGSFQGEDGRPFVVRPTMEDDSVTSVTMSSGLNVPLPIPVIAALHQQETFNMPTLWALSDDQGFVVTLMLSSDQGLYLRLSGAWHLLTEEDVVDGLTTTSVEGTAVDMFDQFDRAGQLVALAAMPLTDPMDVDSIPSAASEPAGTATAVIASTMTRAMPVLGTAEDLPDAIAAAEDDPDIQWWVERRARALGIEADFPWAS